MPARPDLSAVLLRTAHTITMGVFPVISHYNVYPLSRRKYRKRVPWCENLRLLRIILIRCSLCLEEGKHRQSRVKVFRVLYEMEMGLPTVLAMFALCVVLLEPASTTRGQNRVSISIVRYYFRKMKFMFGLWYVGCSSFW